MGNAGAINQGREQGNMPKLTNRTHNGEDRCKRIHTEMNMRVAPTRLEALGHFPAYIIPNLDPLQEQVNRIQNTVGHEARCARRRAWRKAI